MNVKFTSDPVFKTRSWAIAYHLGSKVNPKFHQDCWGTYLYGLLEVDCEGSITEKEAEKLEFPVLETFELDGVTYGRFEVKGAMFWTYLEGEVVGEDDED